MRQLVVAVTGAKGYIGSELCSELLARGHHVIQIDKDLNDCYVELILPNYKPSLEYADCIVHLAAESGIANCQNDPQKAVKSNMIATSMLMDFATNYGDKPVPLIFASSAAASNPMSSLYAMGKYYGEEYARHLNANYDGKNYVLRFSNIYGGEQYLEKKSSVISKLLNAIIEKKEFVISGDGSQTRDFIHVNRVVDAIIKTIELSVNNSLSLVEYLNKPINICSGTELSINDLVQNVIKVINNDNIKIAYDKGSKTVGVTTGSSDPAAATKLDLLPTFKKLWGVGPATNNWPAEDLTNYIRSIFD